MNLGWLAKWQTTWLTYCWLAGESENGWILINENGYCLDFDQLRTNKPFDMSVQGTTRGEWIGVC